MEYPKIPRPHTGEAHIQLDIWSLASGRPQASRLGFYCATLVTVAQLHDPGGHRGVATLAQYCLGLLASPGAFPEVGIPTRSVEEGVEDDKALVVCRAGERVGVASAQKLRTRFRSTLIFNFQIFPVNKTVTSVSGLNQRGNSPVSSSGTLGLQERAGDGEGALLRSPTPFLDHPVQSHLLLPPLPTVRLTPTPLLASNRDGQYLDLGKFHII